MIRRTDDTELQEIDLLTYLKVWRLQTATSAPEYPEAPRFTLNRCTLDDFDVSKVFPARAVDVEHQRFLHPNDEGARAISYAQLVCTTHLREKMFAERKESANGRRRPQPHLIIEHCAECGCKVIKDGCKEFLDIVYHGDNTDIYVTQVSGTDWSKSKYDMRLACSCLKAKSKP